MSNNLPSYLREHARITEGSIPGIELGLSLQRQAADEIEQLRADNAQLQDDIEKATHTKDGMRYWGGRGPDIIWRWDGNEMQVRHSTDKEWTHSVCDLSSHRADEEITPAVAGAKLAEWKERQANS